MIFKEIFIVMSIQLDYEEDFSKGLKRLMIGQCGKAIRYLENNGTEQEKHEAVHEARKAFKKVRACLRLVRDHIDYYKEGNVWFRDRGREISGIRDATADLEALVQLKKQYSSRLYKNAFNTLRDALEQRRKKLAKAVFEQEDRLSSILDAIRAKKEEIPGWPLDIQRFNDIRPGIKRTYKRGVKALHASREDGNVENFHEWRKRAKYLRYQLDVMNRLWPVVFEVLEDELHEVTDMTGTLKDLYNLGDVGAELGNPFRDEDERILFRALIDKQVEYLKKHALLKGRKFYADDPTDFCDRLEVYWKTHRKEIDSKEIPNADDLQYS